MLPQKHRLRKRTDIDRVWKRGRSFLTPIFSLKYAKNDFDYPRFAVIAGLKVDKRAVMRNTLKRRMREAIRRHLAQMNDGYDVVITARASLREKSFAELEETLVWALKKIRLIQN